MHGPSRNADRFFGNLGALVGRLKDKSRLIIAGDFNSHLSNHNLSREEARFIGRYAAHSAFNENGMQMRLFLSLHSLAARNTQSNSNSNFMWTWSNGILRSQVDHLLTHIHSSLFLRHMKRIKPPTISSDHKALFCNIVDNRLNFRSDVPTRLLYKPQTSIDPKMLQDTAVRVEFQKHLRGKATLGNQTGSVETCWNDLRIKIQDTARVVLKKPSLLLPDRKCRLALAQV